MTSRARTLADVSQNYMQNGKTFNQVSCQRHRIIESQKVLYRQRRGCGVARPALICDDEQNEFRLIAITHRAEAHTKKANFFRSTEEDPRESISRHFTNIFACRSSHKPIAVCGTGKFFFRSSFFFWDLVFVVLSGTCGEFVLM